MKDKKIPTFEIKFSTAIVSFFLIILGFLTNFFKRNDPNTGTIFLLLVIIMEAAFLSTIIELMELSIPSIKRFILKYKNNIFDVSLVIILAALGIIAYFTAIYSAPLGAIWAVLVTIIAPPISATLWRRMKEKWRWLEKIRYNGRRPIGRKSRATKKRFLQLEIGIYERKGYGW